MAPSLKERGHPARSIRCPDRLDIDRANRSTSHVKRSRTKTTVVSIRSVSDRLETQRLDAQVDCSDRRLLGCLDSPQARLVATPVADAVGGSQLSADSGPTSGVAAPVRRPKRLHVRASDQGFLPIQVELYVMLLDWTGRELRADKRGAIPDHLAPIMDRLGLNRSNWVETVRGFGRLLTQAAGRPSSLVDAPQQRPAPASRALGSRARRRLKPRLCRPLARR